VEGSILTVTTLNLLGQGDSATIIAVGATGALRRRFAEMGLVRGETIRAVKIAPLGDPVMYSIKGYRLAMRREEAAQIHVEAAPVSEGIGQHA
jgi:Fe2+ transport system protein FeoA